MVHISELTQDNTFRARLIISCFVVALFVSIVYVIVSYRIASELAIQTEFSAMKTEALALHNELLDDTSIGSPRLDSLARILSLDGELGTKVYVRASKRNYKWEYSHNLDANQRSTLSSIAEKQSQETNSNLVIEKNRFIYLRFEGHMYTVELLKSLDAYDGKMRMVTKRLSIITLISLWVVVWLALMLSSMIARRVQRKNDALAKMATHDNLTGLPNRLYLDDVLERVLVERDAQKLRGDVSGCLLAVDLNKFKEVNDSFGHSIGDKLLVKIAERINSQLDKEQVLVRVGGDEFIIWAPSFTISDAETLSNKLVIACNEPVLLNDLDIYTGISIGIAHYPSHANSGEMLIVKADTAMYKAKAQHGGWVVFDDNDSIDHKKQLRLRSDLTHALEREEIKLYYQPKYSLTSGKITGVEALSRWHHPTDGILFPLEFIELVENSGKVQAFGRYVIRQSIKQLQVWQNMGIMTPIAINLSPHNLLDPGLIEYIAQQFSELDIPVDRLEIELTENETSLNISRIKQCLENLKALGVSLAIDDFGTGMSSLSYIANLNVDIVKIDRSFICDMHVNKNHLAIVAAAVSLSTSFECQIVAEGIECEEQVEVLREMGCEYGQGYLFSKPVDNRTVTEMLLRQNELPMKCSFNLK